MVDAPARPATVDGLLAQATQRLRAAGIEGARGEARWLLARALYVSEAELLAHGKRMVPPAVVQQYADLAARRAAREPFAYLVGEREFYGRQFAVNCHVLVPRPETETLIEAALQVLRERTTRSPLIVDVGTGSGAIACTLALEVPDCRRRRIGRECRCAHRRRA